MNTTDTRSTDYAQRLHGFDRGWRRLLDVQRPYRWNIRRLDLGFVLDVGCGVGRNLMHLGGATAGVGVDHSAASVELARARGLQVFTPAEFQASEYARPARFDSLLLAHVVEHMPYAQAGALLKEHLVYVKPGGKVVLIVPQEAGFRSDTTHVEFFRKESLQRLAEACGLVVQKTYSFPFPEVVGKVFPHNETVLVAQRATGG
jgi:SAM-dependent methyltransferase